MKLKQKIVLLAVVCGFMAGAFGVISADTTLAQASEADQDAIDFGRTEEKCEGPNCCGGEKGVKTSIITGDLLCGNESGKPEDSTIFRLLKGLLRIMTFGVGVAAVGGIAWGALLYTTAENKPEQTKKAISVITNAAIGIAAYAAMYVLLNFLIPGGVFS